VLFSEWQADIDNQIKAARAKQRGEARDLTQKEAFALAGAWYCWYTTTCDDNPGDASHWAKLHEILWDRLIDVAGDYETREIDFEAPEVREQIHPLLADEAKTAQFLASKGEAMTPTAMRIFLDARLREFLEALLGVERPLTTRLIITF